MSTRITEIVYRWSFFIQHCLLPPTCVLCRQAGAAQQDLCADCRLSLPLLSRPCPRCALPLPPGAPLASPCGTCLALPPPYQRLHAGFAYHPPVTSLVAGFKYQARLVAGRVLAEALATQIQQNTVAGPLPDLLIPVPLHRRRLRQRGFNQSLEVARWLTKALAIPVRPDLVVRRKHTPRQTGLSAAARRRNLRGAFCLAPDARFPVGASVAIVDDVVTTGSTVTALAKVLRRAGAQDIQVWALARTVI